MARAVLIDRDKFFKAVEQSKQSITAYVLGGKCVSFEDYRNRCGELRGIDVTLDHFKDTVKSEDDDD